jgi:hypothetical protein
MGVLVTRARIEVAQSDRVMTVRYKDPNRDRLMARTPEQLHSGKHHTG